MKRFSTLRVRFALWVAGLLLIALVAFGAFVYASVARSLYSTVDESLVMSASQAVAAVNIENGLVSFADLIPESGRAADMLRARGVSLRVLDTAGTTLAGSGIYHTLPVPAGSVVAALHRQATYATVADSTVRDPIRVYTMPAIEDNKVIGIVQVARSLVSVQQTLDQLLAALLIVGPLLILFAACGGYFLAGRALAPIDQIARTAQRISAKDLSARLDLPPIDDEVGRLATTFDDMLARLDAAFRRERQFTADASHELRTPLAAMQAILGVMRAQRRTVEDYEFALADLAFEADRLHALVDHLLALARGDTLRPASSAPVDLSILLADVVDSLRPLAETKDIVLTCTVPDGLILAGDSDGLIRLFVNLIDNAIKYTDHGAVTVAAAQNANRIGVMVTDTGPGIPVEHLPLIFDRFYRVEAARTSAGAGLGLAIAYEIVQAHAGAIEVSSTVGAGTIFTVWLPT